MRLFLLLFTLLLLREDLLVAQAQAQRGWCISRSGSNQTALQLAIDYACGAGMADCALIQSSGLCYLPNTLQAHASYAFNSYYQKSNGAPGACDFGGTAIVTVTDPSYGSCTYPSSTSAAGSTPTMPTPSNTPITTPGTTPMNTPFSPPFGSTGTGAGSNTPGFGGFSPPDYNLATMTLSHTSMSLFLSGICLYFQLVSI